MPGAKHYYRPVAGISRASHRPQRPLWRRALLGTEAGVALLLVILTALALISPGEVAPRGQQSQGGMEKRLEAVLLDLEAARLAPGAVPPAVCA